MSLVSAIAFTAPAEGGFTIDQGGPTMYGITQTTYDAYRKQVGAHTQPVQVIGLDEVYDIRKDEFWTPAHCGDLTEKMGVAHFDWSFNHSPAGAIKTLQEVAGCVADGVYGTHTKAAFQAAGDALLQPYLDARRAWYRHAAETNPDKYASSLHGWLNRVDNLENYLKGL